MFDSAAVPVERPESLRGAARVQPSATTSPKRAYLSLAQITQKLGVSERTAHKIVNQEWWPRKIELSPRVYRWIEQEIDEAIASHAPRVLERAPEPYALLRSRVERLKTCGGSEPQGPFSPDKKAFAAASSAREGV